MHFSLQVGVLRDSHTYTHTHTHTQRRITSALKQRLNFYFPIHFIFIISLAKSLLNAKLFFGLSNIKVVSHI